MISINIVLPTYVVVMFPDEHCLEMSFLFVAHMLLLTFS